MLDGLMYMLAQLFLYPTLFIITVMFFYSFFILGGFFYEGYTRQKHPIERHMPATIKGNYPILRYYESRKEASIETLELYAHKRLEWVRMVSRTAPMLGLIATLIPLGPALKSLADGNMHGMSEGLIIAFSGVTLGLIAASITYWIGNVKKRWYAAELHLIELHKEGA